MMGMAPMSSGMIAGGGGMMGGAPSHYGGVGVGGVSGGAPSVGTTALTAATSAWTIDAPICIEDVFTLPSHCKVANWPQDQIKDNLGINLQIEVTEDKAYLLRVTGEADGKIDVQVCSIEVKKSDDYDRINYTTQVVPETHFYLPSTHWEQLKMFVSSTFEAKLQEQEKRQWIEENDRLLETVFKKEIVYNEVAHPLTLSYFSERFKDLISGFNIESLAYSAVPLFQKRMLWWRRAALESVTPKDLSNPDFRSNLVRKLHGEPFFVLFKPLDQFAVVIKSISNHEGDFPDPDHYPGSETWNDNFKYNCKMFDFVRRSLVNAATIASSPIQFGPDGILIPVTGGGLAPP